MEALDFEYDSEKNWINEDKHGVDFEWARQLWKVDNVKLGGRMVGGELRHLILAKIEGEHYVAVYTMRGKVIRLITCHRADERLQRIYEKQIETQNSH